MCIFSWKVYEDLAASDLPLQELLEARAFLNASAARRADLQGLDMA